MSLIVVPVVAALIAVLLQGVLLQISVALTGEQAPRFGRALVTALIGGLVSWVAGGVFSVTAGLFLGFVAPGLAWVLGASITIGAAAVVYRSRLGIGLLHAAVVAALQQLLTWAALGAVHLFV
ncbi:MAG: hypothetical protein H6734_28220 [Alphaproteobacteria bacterium]|nr:hypothetical protein [Alphaproteobacteria bacterium]